MTDEAALRCAKAVRQRSRWFTGSALVPAIVGLSLGLLLEQAASKIASTQYLGLTIGLGIVVFLTIFSWRDMLAAAQPLAALQYYCSACIDRLRLHPSPTKSDAAYLSLILPKLEQVLTGRQLNHRAAGTLEARRRVAAVQSDLAFRIGAAEATWLASGRQSGMDELQSCLGYTIIVAEFGWWGRLSPVEADTDAATKTNGTQKDDKPGFVATLWHKAIDKGTDTFLTALIGAIISLAPVILRAM